MSKTLRVVLIRDGDAHVGSNSLQAICHVVATLLAQLRHHLWLWRHVGLKSSLHTTRHQHDVVAPRPDGLVNNQLQRRNIKDGQQLFGHRLGDRVEPRAKSSSRNDGSASSHGFPR